MCLRSGRGRRSVTFAWEGPLLARQSSPSARSKAVTLPYHALYSHITPYGLTGCSRPSPPTHTDRTQPTDSPQWTGLRLPRSRTCTFRLPHRLTPLIVGGGDLVGSKLPLRRRHLARLLVGLSFLSFLDSWKIALYLKCYRPKCQPSRQLYQRQTAAPSSADRPRR